MASMKKALIALFCLACAASVPAKDLNTGIVYGPGHSFSVKAPEGWELDNRSGAAQGLHAVFYPQDSSWSDAAIVMYANAADRTDPAHASRSALIDFDIAQLQRKNPGLMVTDRPAVKTGDGREAVVKVFQGDEGGNFEAVAYIEEAKVVTMLVLSSRDEEVFQSCYSVFEQLVGSYRSLTEDVKVEGKQGGG